MSETIENRASVVKFSNFFRSDLYNEVFSKITLKVTTAFTFFRNRAKFENTAYRPPSNSEIGGKITHFYLARTVKRYGKKMAIFYLTSTLQKPNWYVEFRHEITTALKNNPLKLLC